MRIIITQEEIEEAIEKLILDQVEVPDDMRIDIALKATRGEEGYTAEIDIVSHNAPEDGTDRSVDPRIDVVDGAETLGIAEKVLEAKQQAALPRRRGRPAGARNRPKLSTDHRSTEPKDEVTEEVTAENLPQEAAPLPDNDSISQDDQTVTVGVEADYGTVAEAVETVVGENAAQDVQEAQGEVIEPQPVQETTEAEQVPVETPAAPEVVSEPEPAIEPVSEGLDPAPVDTQQQAVEQALEEAKAPDGPLSEQAVTEAVEEVQGEEVDYTPTPETPGLETSEAEAKPEAVEENQEGTLEPPAVVQPTRSLFANLQRPTNGS